jgi:hypothetical protein
MNEWINEWFSQGQTEMFACMGFIRVGFFCGKIFSWTQVGIEHEIGNFELNESKDWGMESKEVPHTEIRGSDYF